MSFAIRPPDMRDAPVDAEVLIEEARQRQRRRRWAALAAAILVVAGAGGYAAASSGSGSTGRTASRVAPPSRQSPRPVVDATAFHGHGNLAFISHGKLWLLNGATDSLRALPTRAGEPRTPTFSADGKWLSYATASGPHGGQFREWLVRANGTDVHDFRHNGSTIIGWSPAGHLLLEARSAGRALTTLRIIDPAGADRTVATVRGFWDAAWSPDGRELAVTSNGGVTGTTQLLTYPVDGGTPTVWLSRGFHHDPINGMDEPLLDLAGWWPHQGIGVWVVGNGMVSTNDQTPLDLIARPSGTPRFLGRTLLGGSSTSVTATRTGRLALVDNTRHAFGRLIWQGKHVQVCAPDGGCDQPRTPPVTVSLDPTWSPDGHTLAFIDAPASGSPGFPQHVVTRWYAAHRLELYNANTGAIRGIPAARGASAVQWSRNGRSLLYSADDGVWLLPSLTAKPVRIATPLLPRHSWHAYYGQVSWSSQFAWSAR